jgi:hypothetical protein
MAYSAITKPGDHFNTKLYTGNGSTQNITGVGFQPDWTWIKSRGDTSNHRIYDAVRGATKVIYSNLNNAEGTDAQGLTAFGTDGFTLGTEGQSNGNGVNFVSWNWLGNGAGSSNSDGSITSTVSANTTAGFSIVGYAGNATAGATVGHGLGVAPSVVIGKNREASSNSWAVYHKSIGTNLVFFDGTDAASSYSSIYNNTAPSNQVVTLGSGTNVNANGQNIILYCFAEKTGYSKFGSYTGNGSTNGTFVYTGFKPAYVLVKRTDSATGGSWIVQDNKRGDNVRNPVDLSLSPTNNQTESDWGTAYDCDYLANGFKWRYNGAGGYNNTDGATYIYMAFAEEPLVANVGNSIPATAR